MINWIFKIAIGSYFLFFVFFVCLFVVVVSALGVMVKVLDCDLDVSEFKLHLHYDTRFLANLLEKVYVI